MHSPVSGVSVLRMDCMEQYLNNPLAYSVSFSGFSRDDASSFHKSNSDQFNPASKGRGRLLYPDPDPKGQGLRQLSVLETSLAET